MWLSTCIPYQLNSVSDYAITYYRTNVSEIAHLLRIVCSGLYTQLDRLTGRRAVHGHQRADVLSDHWVKAQLIWTSVDKMHQQRSVRKRAETSQKQNKPKQSSSEQGAGYKALDVFA